MLLILPPSETKRDGGDPQRPLELGALGFPGLSRPRRTAIAALRRLARNRETMSAALGLGPQLAFEIERNRSIGTSPTLPALHRYTGVLYDAFDAPRLSVKGVTSAATSVIIHSALFGLLRSVDPIPAYRLSHDSRFPDLRLKALWSNAISRELDAVDGLVVDMRSEAYVNLGPLPRASNRVFLRVVTDGADGTRRAMNHFNKKGKGDLARSVVESGIQHPDVDSLIDWAVTAGIRLERGAPGELVLIVDEIVATRVLGIS